jgi:IS30 family transposase
MTYTHLSQTERYQIHVVMEAGHNQAEIAQILGRHKPTISRELTRGSGRRGYRPRQTQHLSQERLRCSRNTARIAPEIWQAVRGFLALQCSPEQIASQLPISHETIYQKSTLTRRKAVTYGSPCAAKKSAVSAMPVTMIAEAKSLTGARFLNGPSRLNSAPTSGIGRATLSLALRINMPSSPWLREKAVLQW